MDERRVRITCDYVTGTAVEDIAARETISVQRVYQLIYETLRKAGMPNKRMALENFDEFKERLRHNPRRHVELASTPEDFFYELLNERERYCR